VYRYRNEYSVFLGLRQVPYLSPGLQGDHQILKNVKLQNFIFFFVRFA
jgi:hypothetical protein